MKVRINTNQRITNKQNYYDKLKNLLERIDDKIEKSTTIKNEEQEENNNPDSKNEIIISELEKSSLELSKVYSEQQKEISLTETQDLDIINAMPITKKLTLKFKLIIIRFEIVKYFKRKCLKKI